jgi:hypothetical protein
MKKESKKQLEGKVGTATARNISKREGWETGDSSDYRTGAVLSHPHSKLSDHTPGLTAWEQRGGQVDIRVRKGSPVLSGKKVGR